MKDREKIRAIAEALDGIRQQLQTLEAAGKGIPAVEKNALRMSGTLHALEIQFTDLISLWSGVGKS